MKDGYFQVTKVQCDGCRHIFQVPPNFAKTTEQVWKMAEGIHAASGIICGSPVLSVTYVPALVSDSLAEQIDAAIEEAKIIEEKRSGLIVPSANGNRSH